MKTILSFVFLAVCSVTALAGVKTFPLNTPLEEAVFACREQVAAEGVSRLASDNRLDELNVVGPQLLAQRVCVFGQGLITYKKQVLRIQTEHGLFTVYEATVEGVPFPVWIPMKDWEHAQS